MVFDVIALRTPNTNHELYQLGFSDYDRIYRYLTTSNCMWYQHRSWVRNYHFLTAITRKNLDLLGGFDYAFAFGSCYDDDEFLFRIKHRLKLNIHNVFVEENRLLGAHQWHTPGVLQTNTGYIATNKQLYHSKIR